MIIREKYILPLSLLEQNIFCIFCTLLLLFFIVVTSLLLFIDTFLFPLLALFPLLNLKSFTPLANNSIYLSIIKTVKTVFHCCFLMVFTFFHSELSSVNFVVIICLCTLKIFVAFCFLLFFYHAIVILRGAHLPGESNQPSK